MSLQSVGSLIRPLEAVALEDSHAATAATSHEGEIKEKSAATCSLEELEKLAEDRVVSVAQEIIRAGGIRYNVDHFKELEAAGNQKEIQELRNKGSFFHGMLSDKYFGMIPDPRFPTGVKMLAFKIKPGVKPSEALEAIKKGPSVLDCSTTVQVVYWTAIMKLLGEEKFNALFSGESPTPLRLGSDDSYYRENILHMLLPIEIITEGVPIKKGHYAYIEGPEAYVEVHPAGHARGFASICSENIPGKPNKFVALGLPAEGVTLDETPPIFEKEYDKPAQKVPDVSATVLRQFFGGYGVMRHGSITHVTEKPFNAMQFVPKNPKNSLGISTERIAQLAKASFEEGSKLLQTWQSEYRIKYKF
jgi:hypothetical protein